MPKVAYIGVGSVTFAQTLISDVLSYPELRDVEIALMDVDAERLDQTTELADAMVRENGFDASLQSTMDRREALRDADYVVNMIHVGGREPFENEVEIPAEHGVKQAVGDTIGPGGVFRALRTIPTMVDIARDMEELCPDAPLLNYTNPMAMNCWALDEATDVDVFGLCHSVQGTAKTLAEYLDVPHEDSSTGWPVSTTWRGSCSSNTRGGISIRSCTTRCGIPRPTSGTTFASRCCDTPARSSRSRAIT